MMWLVVMRAAFWVLENKTRKVKALYAQDYHDGCKIDATLPSKKKWCLREEKVILGSQRLCRLGLLLPRAIGTLSAAHNVNQPRLQSKPAERPCWLGIELKNADLIVVKVRCCTVQRSQKGENLRKRECEEREMRIEECADERVAKLNSDT